MGSGQASTDRHGPPPVPSSHDEPLLGINSFVVLIGDLEVGFASVGRLTSETDPDAVRADRPGHRLVPVVLRRAITRSTDLYEWRRQVVAGRDDRRDVTIRQLSAPGGRLVNEWTLVNAWPRRWSGPAFDALSDDIAYEEIELMFEDLVWLDRKPAQEED
jgi:phage tail-like protein